MASGSVWRVRAWGTVTSASSATARNLDLALFWGGTKINVVVAFVVKTSTVATALPWEAEWMVSGGGVSSASVLATGQSPITNGTITGATMVDAFVSGVGITSGSQTLDLQVAFSVLVSGDSSLAQGITMERLQ